MNPARPEPQPKGPSPTLWFFLLGELCALGVRLFLQGVDSVGHIERRFGDCSRAFVSHAKHAKTAKKNGIATAEIAAANSTLFRFSWEWRRRFPSKVKERTHEEALHAGRESRHFEAASVFYRWQKEFFENGTAALQPKARPNHSAEQGQIDYLEKKIQTKDEVLAELMAEHVALKTLGEL